MSSLKSKIAAGILKKDFKALKNKLDYSEYGGAGLFGLAAPVIKAHGSSNGRAIYNAIKQTSHMIEYKVTDVIKETIKEMSETNGGQE